jgi:hypothetical protein
MQATVHDDPIEVSEVLAGTLGGELEKGRGLNGYTHANLVKRADETLARVLYGGPNGWCHVIASGAQTDDVAPVIRGAWKGLHEVTRMDTAQDFDQEGGYEQIRALMLDIAESAGLSRQEVESVVNGQRSRTTYLGAPSSRVRVRLYEKGAMERQSGNDGALEHWIRLEAQIRPTGQNARQNASELDASEAWGQSRWTRELARRAMDLDVPQVTMQLRREPDYMRAIRACRDQYAATLKKALLHEGSWENVGKLLDVL